MTPPAPQKEYIITETGMKRIALAITFDQEPDPDIFDELMSLFRPAPTPDALLKTVLQEQKKQRAAFRLCWDKQTIDLVKEWGESIRIIETALRQQQEQQK